MTRLYTLKEAKRWKQRAALMLALATGLVALALIVCIALCTQVNTGNAQSLLSATITLFTLAGWTAILLGYFGYLPARAQAEHIGGMTTGTEEELEGVLTLLPETFRIPKSVTVRRATLDTPQGPVSLSVSAALSRQLPTGVPLRVLTVRRFVAGYEVIA